MLIFKKINDIQKYLSAKRKLGNIIGFIPTLGALHAGHASLIKKANADGVVSVCSIFLNPTQFNNRSDYENYPVTIDADIELLLNTDCKVLFIPSETEIYPDTNPQINHYDFGFLETILEGQKRPGHFKGVGQVVARLLQITNPDYLYLGQKDYQQCMIIENLISQIKTRDNYSMDTKIIVCPTLREADGLAMSSRNRRLTDPQRIIASTIYQCLIAIQAKQNTDSFDKVQKECIDILTQKGFVPDYVALANAQTLNPMPNFDAQIPMVALIAATIGNVRLIDNILL